MSRFVDPHAPLSDEDRAYLLARGYDDQVAAMDERQADPDRLQVEPEEIVVEDEGDDYDDESVWTYSDLQQEARNRGLAANGKREEVVARLRKHDEENA